MTTKPTALAIHRARIDLLAARLDDTDAHVLAMARTVYDALAALRPNADIVHDMGNVLASMNMRGTRSSMVEGLGLGEGTPNDATPVASAPTPADEDVWAHARVDLARERDDAIAAVKRLERQQDELKRTLGEKTRERDDFATRLLHIESALGNAAVTGSGTLAERVANVVRAGSAAHEGRTKALNQFVTVEASLKTVTRERDEHATQLKNAEHALGTEYAVEIATVGQRITSLLRDMRDLRSRNGGLLNECVGLRRDRDDTRASLDRMTHERDALSASLNGLASVLGYATLPPSGIAENIERMKATIERQREQIAGLTRERNASWQHCEAVAKKLREMSGRGHVYSNELEEVANATAPKGDVPS